MLKKLLLLVLLFPLSTLHAQVSEEDHGYAAVDTFRVFRSLGAALNQPDSVYSLDLSRTKLKEVPVEILRFPNLQVLKLSRNDLRALPEWIGQLKNLHRLELNNNRLKALPDSIGMLSNLEFLGLNRNLIETLPHTIGDLKSLRTLEMWDNELQAVPEEIKNLKNLEVFELRGILFSDEDQRQISELLPDTKIFFSPSCNCKQ